MDLREREQRRQQRLEKARLRREQDVKFVMESPQGKRFVVALDGIAQEPSWQKNGDIPADPLVLAYNEGRRSVARQVLDEVRRHAPASYAQMMLESIREENELAATLAAEAVPSAGEASRR